MPYLLGRAVEKSFVLGVRAIEASLGINCDSTFDVKAITDTITLAALKASVPIIKRLSKAYGLPLAGLPSIQALAAGTAFNGNRFASLNRNQCLSTMCVRLIMGMTVLLIRCLPIPSF